MSLLILSHTFNKPRRTVILFFRSSVLVLIDQAKDAYTPDFGWTWIISAWPCGAFTSVSCFCVFILQPSPWREKNTADPPCFLHLWWHQSWGSSWPGQEVEQCASSRCASKTVSDQGQCRMEMPKIKTSRGPTFYHFKPSIVFVFVSLWTHQNSSSVSFETELQTQLRFLLLS